MRDKLTLKQMAEILGYSASTVSKALNDSPEISEETKKKIKKVARFYHYVPNEIARSLKKGNAEILSISIPRDERQKCQQLLNEIMNMSPKPRNIIGRKIVCELKSNPNNQKDRNDSEIVLLRFE